MFYLPGNSNRLSAALTACQILFLLSTTEDDIISLQSVTMATSSVQFLLGVFILCLKTHKGSIILPIRK